MSLGDPADQKNRRHSIKILYQKYHASVQQLCMRFCKNQDIAEDLTQEVFLKILSRYHLFEDRSSPFTWIFRITVNHCLDWVRSRQRGMAAATVCDENVIYQVAQHGPAFDERLSDADLLETLLQGCSPTLRYILHLYYGEGYSHQEIAARLGMRRVTVTRKLLAFRRRAMWFSPILGRSLDPLGQDQSVSMPSIRGTRPQVNEADTVKSRQTSTKSLKNW